MNYLHMLSKRAGMSVGLVTHFAQIWFVRRVNVHMFLSVTAVREAPITALILTLKWLLPCEEKRIKMQGLVKINTIVFNYKKTVATGNDEVTIFI